MTFQVWLNICISQSIKRNKFFELNSTNNHIKVNKQIFHKKIE
jgi:hypothetical protein